MRFSLFFVVTFSVLFSPYDLRAQTKCAQVFSLLGKEHNLTSIEIIQGLVEKSTHTDSPIVERVKALMRLNQELIAANQFLKELESALREEILFHVLVHKLSELGNAYSLIGASSRALNSHSQIYHATKNIQFPVDLSVYGAGYRSQWIASAGDFTVLNRSLRQALLELNKALFDFESLEFYFELPNGNFMEFGAPDNIQVRLNGDLRYAETPNRLVQLHLHQLRGRDPN